MGQHGTFGEVENARGLAEKHDDLVTIGFA
jgi:hypothetical protein